MTKSLEQMKQEARRDDWQKFFVGSDIRQLIRKIEMLQMALLAYAAICPCPGILVEEDVTSGCRSGKDCPTCSIMMAIEE